MPGLIKEQIRLAVEFLSNVKGSAQRTSKTIELFFETVVFRYVAKLYSGKSICWGDTPIQLLKETIRRSFPIDPRLIDDRGRVDA